MTKPVGVVKPDSGNITSICDCLERMGRDYQLLETPQDLDRFSGLLLPGQGRFGAVMRYLNRTGWREALTQWCLEDKPLIGICVGMQVLFDSSDEDEEPGLGILVGHVKRMDAPKHPMIGWAELDWKADGLPEGAAYFVNSYAVYETPYVLGEATYRKPFVAAVRRGNLTAFQFHPEKSGNFGKELMNLCLDF
jgi:imidazole glycerol phosphate synthase glutamine amidotransferase subunit